MSVLKITRKLDEGITIKGPCHIIVDYLSRGRVRLVIEAAEETEIVRDELLDQWNGRKQTR